MYMSRRVQKTWSWISRRLNPGMAVLTKTKFNLNDRPPDRGRQPETVSWRRSGRRRIPHCWKQRRAVVRQAPASEDRSPGTRKVRNLWHWECYQATTGEDTADREDIMHVVINYRLGELLIALLTRNYLFLQSNKFNYQSKPRV
jgi:hypothetical protein